MSGILWNLKISSWAGISLGAEHWYPTLSASGGNGQRYRVEQVISVDYAQELTVKDNDMSSDNIYAFRPGETTNRFQTKELAVAAGIAVFDHLSDEGDVLMHGESAYALPMGGALAGPEDLVRRINEVVAEAEAIGWWDHDANHKQMDSLVKDYEAMLTEFGIEQHGESLTTNRSRHELEAYVSDGKWIAEEDLPDPYADEVHGGLIVPPM